MSRTGPSREVTPGPARRCDPWSFLLVTLAGADVHPRRVPVVRAARLLLRLPATSLPPCCSCSTDTTRTFPSVVPSWSLPSPPANAGAPGDPRTSSAASVAAAGSARRSSAVSPWSSRCSQEDPLLTGGSTAVRDRGNSVRSRRGTPLPHRPRRRATGAPRSGTPARPWPSAPTPASGATVSTMARRRAATPRKSRVAAPVGLVAEPWFAAAAWPTASASAERRRGHRGRRPRTRKAPTGVSAGGGLLRCSPDWTRTSNPSINSRMLCQLSYGGPCTHACNEQSLYRPGTGNAKSPLSPGGGCGAASPARAARAGAPGSAPAAPRGRCAAARPAGRTCAG